MRVVKGLSWIKDQFKTRLRFTSVNRTFKNWSESVLQASNEEEEEEEVDGGDLVMHRSE